MNYYNYSATVGTAANIYNDMDCIVEPAGGRGGLWVGNYAAATNTDLLLSTGDLSSEYGIRAVVTCATEATVGYDSQAIPYHLKVPALDYEGFSLDPYFEQVTDFIDGSLASTNVLVHCMAGVSRSVSFVIAYLMKYRALHFEDGLNLVRSRRSVVRTMRCRPTPTQASWSS